MERGEVGARVEGGRWKWREEQAGNGEEGGLGGQGAGEPGEDLPDVPPQEEDSQVGWSSSMESIMMILRCSAKIMSVIDLLTSANFCQASFQCTVH